MTRAADPLRQLEARIKKDSALPVFPFVGPLPSENRVRWDGEDVGEFLQFAKKVGATTLYLSSDMASEDDEDTEGPAHAGEVAIVVAAFLQDGVFHEFVEVAGWVEPEEGEGLELDATDTSGAERALKTNEEAWTREFVESLTSRPEPVDPSRFSIDQQLRRFLAARVSTKSLAFSPMGISHDGSGLDLLVQKIAGEVSATLLTEERKKVEPMVADCAAWGAKLGIRSLARTDVEAYLLERGVHLSVEGKRLLWTQAKLELKVGRTSGKSASPTPD
jgi:hypothetical protein